MKTAYKVSVENLGFLSVGKADFVKTMRKFDDTINNLEKFLKTLEKKFGEIIWYIGTDFFSDDINERFMFKKSGIMEITIKKDTELNAFFTTKKKAENFIKALRKTLKKLESGGRIKKFYE